MANMREQGSYRAEEAVIPASIRLPAGHIALDTWAVVACDQWTQDKGYWEETARCAGSRPSTLNLIFPEVYLEDGDERAREERILKIHQTMRSYLDEGVFAPAETGFLYLERETTGGTRRGLLAAIDLECYDWRPASRPLIRASEGTIEARLPPRMAIRRAAPLELPHIMLLIDDAADALLGGLAAEAGPFIYDTALMQGGGRVRARFVRDAALVSGTFAELARVSPERYGIDEAFLLAVGDGNHSLAAAKAVWDEYKAYAMAGGPVPSLRHPLRYALVEIVNLYDTALRFEPIHRVLFGAPRDSIIPLAAPFTTRPVSGPAELAALVKEKGENTRFGIIQGKACLLVEASSPLLAPALLEPELDRYRAAHPGTSVDYIHGEDALFTLCAQKPCAGFLLPPFEKSGLFETIAQTGPLPRKSFSMGEARDKRYYLEARSLAQGA